MGRGRETAIKGAGNHSRQLLRAKNIPPLLSEWGGEGIVNRAEGLSRRVSRMIFTTLHRFSPISISSFRISILSFSLQ